MAESLGTSAKDTWNILRAAREGTRGVSDDAKAISFHVLKSYDPQSNPIVEVFEKPEMIEDIISYAVMYFLREIGMRCDAARSQLPCVLTMASLSERFVPALFEQNLKKLYGSGPMSRLPNIIKDSTKVHKDKQSKFSTNLATMMIQIDTLRRERAVGSTIPSGFGQRSIWPLGTPTTDNIFIPSPAEIVASFRHVVTFQKSGTRKLPSDNILSGSSLLLIAISTAFNVIPELESEARKYYEEDRLTEEGFRLSVNTLLRRASPTRIALEITPYLFAACCSHLVYIGKTFNTVSVDIGARGGEPEGAHHVPLGNTMRFHIGALGADSANTRKAILKSFMNLASAWMTPQGRPFGLQRAATTEDARSVIQARADGFFSILFAMVYSLMPTEESVIHEETLIYKNIFHDVPLLAQGDVVGKEAFEQYARRKVGEQLHAFPTKPSLDTFLVTRETKDVDFLIHDREILAGERDPLDIILAPGERKAVDEAMDMIMQENRNFPVIVGLDFPQEGSPITTSPGQLGVVEEGEDPDPGSLRGGRRALVDVIMQFDDDDFFDTALVKGWGEAYAMSTELLESLNNFDEFFPFERDERGKKDKPIETPPEENLEEQRRKMDELSETINSVFGISQEQISAWFSSGDLDVNDKEQMAAIEELKNVIQRSDVAMENRLNELELKQKTALSELKKQLEECKENERGSAGALKKVISEKSKLNILQKRTTKELENKNKEIVDLEAKITELKAGGEDVQPKDLAALEEQLEDCKLDLEDITKEREEFRKNQNKLFILKAVVQQMADSEGNTTLKDILANKEGGLNDMYAYATAFGMKSREFVKKLESAKFTPTDANNRTFAAGEEIRPSYSLTTGQVAETKKKARGSISRAKTIRSAIPRQETQPLSAKVHHPAPSMASVTNQPRAKAQDSHRAKEKPTASTRKETSLLNVLKQADARPLCAPLRAGKKPLLARKDRVRLKDEESVASILEHEGRISSEAFCESGVLQNTSHISGMATSIDVKMQIFSGRSVLEEERSTFKTTEPADLQEMADEPQEEWGYYEEDIQGDSGDYYNHPGYEEEEEELYEDEDIAWPIQDSESYTSKSDRYEVRHYGMPAAFKWKPHTFTNHHVPHKEKRNFGFAPKTRAPLSTEFKEQARCSVTALVAGVLAIVSTRIYQATHADPSQTSLHLSSSAQSKRKKRNNANKKSADALILNQLTMPKKFDDSCRKANKESDTIPKAEQMILLEWNKLLCLSSTPRAAGSKDNLTQFVQELSYAIEHGNGKRAREAMISLCTLVSFSKNVQVTMTNMVREMHTATSRFRCTTTRNEMMECVRRTNGIKF